MATPNKRKAQRDHDDPAQSKAFIEKAKEIGADDDALRTDDVMRLLAKTPPKPKAKSSDS